MDYPKSCGKIAERVARLRELRDMISRVLSEDSFRKNARRLQASLAAAGGVAQAADITEMAVTTRQPVPASALRVACAS